MLKQAHLILLLSIVAAASAACSSDANLPLSDIRCTASDGYQSVTKINYWSEGVIDTIDLTSGQNVSSLDFYYSGDNVSEIRALGLDATLRFDYNSNGQMDFVSLTGEETPIQTVISYNSDNYVDSFTTSMGGESQVLIGTFEYSDEKLRSVRRGASVDDFRWNGDNLTRIYRGTSSVSFEYADDVLSVVDTGTSRTRVSYSDDRISETVTTSTTGDIVVRCTYLYASGDEDVRGMRMTPSFPFGVHFTLEGRPWSEPSLLDLQFTWLNTMWDD